VLREDRVNFLARPRDFMYTFKSMMHDHHEAKKRACLIAGAAGEANR
jgi:hypothetical protein